MFLCLNADKKKEWFKPWLYGLKWEYAKELSEDPEKWEIFTEICEEKFCQVDNPKKKRRGEEGESKDKRKGKTITKEYMEGLFKIKILPKWADRPII